MILEVKYSIIQIKISVENLVNRKGHAENRVSGLEGNAEELAHSVRVNDAFIKNP